MKHLQKLFELTPEVIYTLDTRGKITYLSPAFTNKTDWKVEDWVGKTFKGIIHPGDLPRAIKVFLQVNRGKGVGPYELRVKKADGSYIVGEFTTAPLLENKKVVGQIGIARDITERNRLTVELQKSRHDLEIILENLAEGVSVIDPEGRLIYVNTAIALASKYKSAQEMIQYPERWFKRFELRDEKGELFDINLMPTRLALKGVKNPETLINFIDRKTGESRWSYVKARSKFDDEGKISMIVTIITDVTERINLEKKKDEFMSVASHELRTPLTSLKIYSELLKNKAEKKGIKVIQKDVQNISRQVDRITNLVTELFDISKINNNKLILNKTEFNFNSLVKDVVNDMGKTYPRYKFVLQELVNIDIKADKDRLEQVLINILSNAAKYSTEKSTVTVTIKKAQNNLVCMIADQGQGIPKENISKIFERFYRIEDTKNSHLGLGMGLFISQQIIKSHGGEITVKSKLGKGSVFSFTLPLNK